MNIQAQIAHRLIAATAKQLDNASQSLFKVFGQWDKAKSKGGGKGIISWKSTNPNIKKFKGLRGVVLEYDGKDLNLDLVFKDEDWLMTGRTWPELKKAIRAELKDAEPEHKVVIRELLKRVDSKTIAEMFGEGNNIGKTPSGNDFEAIINTVLKGVSSQTPKIKFKGKSPTGTVLANKTSVWGQVSFSIVVKNGKYHTVFSTATDDDENWPFSTDDSNLPKYHLTIQEALSESLRNTLDSLGNADSEEWDDSEIKAVKSLATAIKKAIKLS